MPGLKLARQPYYRWRADPVTDAEYVEAHRASALLDAHRDDPQFGHRFLDEGARDAGQSMPRERPGGSARTTAGGVRSGNASAVRTARPVHRSMTIWSAGISPLMIQIGCGWLLFEHRTAEGMLYLCAIKDVFSNRIAGYSIDSRMKSRLAAHALASAVARRGDVAGCIVHTGAGRNFQAGDSSTPWTATTRSARWAMS